MTPNRSQLRIRKQNMNDLNQSAIICTFGAPVLRAKARPVTVFDRNLADMAEDMLRRMYIANGIGLAAPQIGKSIQLLVIDLQQDNTSETVTLDGRVLPINLVQPFYCVNPSFEPVNDVQVLDSEGCLSLPDVRGNVKRYYEIVLKYQDLDGAPHVMQCRDLLARCVQHECDHLRGILFIDRLSKTERRENQALLNEIKSLGGSFAYTEEDSD